jgi:ATP phosphoribosyltransferase
MKTSSRLRIAVQKSGRLNSDSMDLLSRCGLKIRATQNTLYCHGENIPIDILFVRDDDIPTLVMDDVCDLGIVGENVLIEKTMKHKANGSKKNFEMIKKLGFSRCRLSIAVPQDTRFDGPHSLQGLRIATSYPYLLQSYLDKHNLQAEIMTIAGSLEIAPRLNMSDAICDLVSTGKTLEENNLKEVGDPVMESQAVLIQTKNPLSTEKLETLELLLRRIDGVLKAQESKYIMFHAPYSSLAAIKEILPGCETPTIVPLDGIQDKVAVHVVSSEGIFWITLEKLKQAGASSILVLPIEKMLN